MSEALLKRMKYQRKLMEFSLQGVRIVKRAKREIVKSMVH